MDPLDRLSNEEEFHKLYADIAGSLARLLNMGEHVEEGVLDEVYFGWIQEVAAGITLGEIDPKDSRFSTDVLGRLGPWLCQPRCVSYNIASINMMDRNFAQHQMLLLSYPAQYTAAELIRHVHMDIFYSRDETRHLTPRPRPLVAMNPAQLQQIFMEIQRRPTVLRQYPHLLGLPE